MGGKGSGGRRPGAAVGRPKGSTRIDERERILVNEICDRLAVTEALTISNVEIAKVLPEYSNQIEQAFTGERGGDAAARQRWLKMPAGRGHQKRVEDALQNDLEALGLMKVKPAPAITKPSKICFTDRRLSAEGTRLNIDITVDEGDDPEAVKSFFMGYRPNDWYEFEADEGGAAWLRKRPKMLSLTVKQPQTKLEAEVKRLARAELLQEHGIDITIDMIGRVWRKRYRTSYSSNWF